MRRLRNLAHRFVSIGVALALALRDGANLTMFAYLAAASSANWYFFDPPLGNPVLPVIGASRWRGAGSIWCCRCFDGRRRRPPSRSPAAVAGDDSLAGRASSLQGERHGSRLTAICNTAGVKGDLLRRRDASGGGSSSRHSPVSSAMRRRGAGGGRGLRSRHGDCSASRRSVRRPRVFRFAAAGYAVVAFGCVVFGDRRGDARLAVSASLCSRQDLLRRHVWRWIEALFHLPFGRRSKI